MHHLYSSAPLKHALVFIVLLTSTPASASLLDCTESPGAAIAAGVDCASLESSVEVDQPYSIKEAAPSLEVGFAGYQVDQTRNSGALPESAPLLVLLGSLLAVLLVRAKNRNSK